MVEALQLLVAENLWQGGWIETVKTYFMEEDATRDKDEPATSEYQPSTSE